MGEAKDPLIPSDLVAKQAELLDKDEQTRLKFLEAIETQITAADKEGIEPLVAYIRKVQIAGGAASKALAALIKEKEKTARWLSDDERAVLRYFANDKSGTTEAVMAKFAGGLEPADKKVVDEWLKWLTERERSYVTTGAIVGRDIDGGLFLAVNLYRATLAGVSLEKLRSALRICQIYCGLPAYVAASQTLVILGEVLHKMKPDATPAQVIEALIKRYDVSY